MVGGSSHHPELLQTGEIRLPERVPLANRLARIHAEVVEIVTRFSPTGAAVEAPFHGASARSSLQLAHARGATLAALGGCGVQVWEYSPATIKLSVTGNGRADKEQVAVMVRRLVAAADLPGGPDTADAVAAALCHLFGSAFAAAIEKTDAVQDRRR